MISKLKETTTKRGNRKGGGRKDKRRKLEDGDEGDEERGSDEESEEGDEDVKKEEQVEQPVSVYDRFRSQFGSFMTSITNFYRNPSSSLPAIAASPPIPEKSQIDDMDLVKKLPDTERMVLALPNAKSPMSALYKVNVEQVVVNTLQTGKFASKDVSSIVKAGNAERMMTTYQMIGNGRMVGQMKEIDINLGIYHNNLYTIEGEFTRVTHQQTFPKSSALRLELRIINGSKQNF